MKREALVSLSPDEVLDLAKEYFSDVSSGYGGTLIEEGDGFVRFDTFRGHLAVYAIQEEGTQTRVRCSTLQYHPSIGKFLMQLQTESSPAGE